jgi:hypothetical protein
MKELNKHPYEELVHAMINRHTNLFVDCFCDETLNRDYSNYPTQVLIKYNLPDAVVHQIDTYNKKFGTDFGYSCSQLFALRKINGKYVDEFQICERNDGIEILMGLLETIISNNPMSDDLMKKIEKTQTLKNSRKATISNPKLFLMYLPTHTGSSVIDLLQKALIKFIEEHGLWSKYHVEYSNGKENSGPIGSESFNKFLKTILIETKRLGKRGCILLLGEQGTTGITYHDCDVTLSLDDAHSLDNIRQRFARPLTESQGKTIGINVDFNIQRTIVYLTDIIQRHRRNTKTTMSDKDIM